MADGSSPPEQPRGQRRMWVIAAVFVMIASSVLGVAGAYVYGGADPIDPPETELAFDHHDGSELTITHDGGDSLRAGNVEILVGDGRTTWAQTDFSIDPSDELTQGDSTTISGISAGDTVTVVLDRGEQTFVVGEFEVGRA
ncbi:hypothetical protein [Haloarchaeobius sp. DFWS5]|uniref:hypothetical protein n=1 Tax=Haloarchaeobius sp. DFWS5 TaxID=3446114 RepID=UPI003EBA7723